MFHLLKKFGYTLPKNNCHCYDQRTNCEDLKALDTAQLPLYFVGNGPHGKIRWALRRHYIISSFDWKCKFT